jgi:hypothetical protein
MIESDGTTVMQKMTTIWSARREREIVTRIYFDAREEDGCRIYTLRRLEEL